jgi:murein DD-endopeptidase MepM/ murein hydrolase activator NlpD
VRQRGATSIDATIAANTRRIGLLAFACWLAFSALPLTVLAAPPEPYNAAVAGDAATHTDDGGEKPNAERLPGSDKESTGSLATANRFLSGWGSVRRRGLEAPVQLRPRDSEDTAPEVEKGDGVPPRSSNTKTANKAEQKSTKDEPAHEEENLRVWPMRANSYTFTQPFGCVPQIANFYFPGEGCPADAPVIHSGIDLAAPEGTPFYAAAAGWVTSSGYDREVGVPNTRIIIQHVGRNEDYSTVYLHWVASYVEPGDYVEAGEMIGEVGNVGYSTGPHLHFEVVDLESGENIDPIGWLPKTPGNEGYRGRQPNGRAAMRLPAGTTAGLP